MTAEEERFFECGKTRHKILVAVGGSAQSLNAVRYVGKIFPPSCCRITLFSVDSQIPNFFPNIDENLYYRSQIAPVRNCLAGQRKKMRDFMDQAVAILKSAGFSESAIEVKIQKRRINIIGDILSESLNGYSAVVVGRTGLSRLKDNLFGSFAVKLVGKIKLAPLVIVGGAPESKRIFVAFDGSRGSMKGVHAVGNILGRSIDEVMVCHITLPSGSAPRSMCSGDIYSRLDQARKCLTDFGLEPDCVCCQVRKLKDNTSVDIVDAARRGGYETIVVGRRELISIFEGMFLGRVSQKVLQLADEAAVWVIS